MKPKAIALMSGGLDSALATKMVKDQGVEIIGLHLVSPFGCEIEVSKVAEEIGIPLLFKEKGASYLELVENPKYGYGRAMNPCIDCRIFMFKLAHKVMDDEGADFIVTGEVLGQRPMSQQKNSMELIDKNSPLQGRVLRPLSAHMLEPTIPEEKGWVERDKLLGIWGRGRKDQLALAKEWGLTQFKSPGGGCLLTEVAFGQKLKDFFQNPTFTNEEQKMAQSQILRFGRHFRISEKTKVIVGRNQRENEEIERLWPKTGGSLFRPHNFDGPSAIGFGDADEERDWIGAIVSRYGKSELTKEIEMAADGSVFVPSRTVTDTDLEGMRV